MKKLLIVFIGVLLSACSNDDPKAIKGLEHSDLYLNLKDKGFTDESNVTDLGVSHISQKESFGAKYQVSSIGTSKYLYGYTASVTADYDLSKNIDANQFLQFVTTLPYDGSQPEVIRLWVENNYNETSKDTIIGGVKFELKAPTKFTRLLQVSKE